MRSILATTATLTLLFFFPGLCGTARAQRAPTCCGSLSEVVRSPYHLVESNLFDFIVESLVGHPATDSPIVEFQRYVYNAHDQPVKIVDWESVKVSGYANPQMCVSSCFSDIDGAHIVAPRTLWYGTSPLSITPDTLLRSSEAPSEAHSQAPPSSPTSLRQAFASFEVMVEFLRTRGRVALESRGTVAVPAHPYSLARLADRNALPWDFVAMDVLVRERLELRDGVPYGQLGMSLHVKDLKDILLLDRRLPRITFRAEDPRLTERLLPSEEGVVVDHSPIIFYDREPAPLTFPVQRIMKPLSVYVAEGAAARLDIPFGVVSGESETRRNER